MKYHASYIRWLKIPLLIIQLSIDRVKCSCGATHALLPECIVPYSRIPLDTQIDTIKNFFSDYSSKYKVIIKDFLHSYNIDYHDYLYIKDNYLNKWKLMIESIEITICDDDITEVCFEHFNRQFMQIKLTTYNLYTAFT
jgi:hypothetical protein